MIVEPGKPIKLISDSYSGAFNKFSILKRGKKFIPLKIQQIALRSHVKDLKLRDIKTLINKLGINENHEAHNFYKKVEESCTFGTVVDSDDDE